MAEKTITNEQQIKATLSPKTSTGKPAEVDGVPTWEVLTGESVTMTSAEDGMSADFVSSDTVQGDTQIKVKADADLGEGVIEISDIITITVVHAQAENLGLSLGDPTPKP